MLGFNVTLRRIVHVIEVRFLSKFLKGTQVCDQKFIMGMRIIQELTLRGVEIRVLSRNFFGEGQRHSQNYFKGMF